MLAAGIIHADLSPYNVLIDDRGPVVIDFPQCVSASHNNQAGELLIRDVQSITRHLALFDPGIKQLGDDAWQIWAEYEAGRLTPEFMPIPGRARFNATPVDTANMVQFLRQTRLEVELERRAERGSDVARQRLHDADISDEDLLALQLAAAEARDRAGQGENSEFANSEFKDSEFEDSEFEDTEFAGEDGFDQEFDDSADQESSRQGLRRKDRQASDSGGRNFTSFLDPGTRAGESARTRSSAPATERGPASESDSAAFIRAAFGAYEDVEEPEIQKSPKGQKAPSEKPGGKSKQAQTAPPLDGCSHGR
jgi:hypothetical protein